MRTLVVLCAAVAAAAAVSRGHADAAPSSRTSLTIVYRARPAAPAVTRTLQCVPAGGTLANAEAACRRLAGLENPFAPVPPGTACTEIYGGPERASVSGSFRGHRVWARFSKADGCQINRWKRVGFLFASLD
jgi:Subtilisin inhibitor-like